MALARVAAGGARWWLTATRSGAERADGPVVLAAGAHRGTPCAPCGRYGQTAAMSQITKCAARTAPASALLGAPLKSPPPGTACRDAGCVVFGCRGPGFPSLAPALLAGVTGGCTGAAGIIRACHIGHARPPRWSRQRHGALQRHLRDWRPTRCGRPARWPWTQCRASGITASLQPAIRVEDRRKQRVIRPVQQGPAVARPAGGAARIPARFSTRHGCPWASDRRSRRGRAKGAVPSKSGMR